MKSFIQAQKERHMRATGLLSRMQAQLSVLANNQQLSDKTKAWYQTQIDQLYCEYTQIMRDLVEPVLEPIMGENIGGILVSREDCVTIAEAFNLKN